MGYVASFSGWHDLPRSEQGHWAALQRVSGDKRNTWGGGRSLTRILSQPKKADGAGRQRLAASSGLRAMRPRLAWGPESRQISREARALQSRND